MESAALITLDWGSSNLRARLFDRQGKVLEIRTSAQGLLHVPERSFEPVLLDLCGEWLRGSDVPLIASGMIGAREGWVEAPYLKCPATAQDAADALVPVPLTGGAVLHIVPGLKCRAPSGQDDLMRGEETQLWGLEPGTPACCVLPGTHSKWARLDGWGRITGFETSLTGELYALLTRHGTLARLMRYGEERPEHFDEGAALGLQQYDRLPLVLFSARTAGLSGRVPPEGLPDFLSGLLIGAEVGSALAYRPQRDIKLLGEPDLCSRYERVLRRAGMEPARAPADATARGQWRIAMLAGLVKEYA
jgi:2-dehydro-3-deoxygalactonokinase